MLCPHRIDGNCKIAEEFTGFSVQCRDDAFKFCSECKCPFTKNHVSASLAYSALKERNLLTSDKQSLLLHYIRQGSECKEIDLQLTEQGVGTELHKILKERGWEIEPGCSCLEMIVRMNKEGVEWCRSNSDSIIRTMVYEWQRRHQYAAYIIPKWALNTKSEELIELAIQQYQQTAV